MSYCWFFLKKTVFYINDLPIENVARWPHLGHIITENLDDSDEINNKCRTFVGQVNNLLCYFGKLSSHVKSRLFQSYCTSLYGSVLWPVAECALSGFGVAWRKALRRVWNLPLNSHCCLLSLLSDNLPFVDEVCSRTIKFIGNCIDHCSELVQFIARQALFFTKCSTPLGRNMAQLSSRYGFGVTDWLHQRDRLCRVVKQTVKKNILDADRRVASMLFELISIRDGCFTLTHFNKDEIHEYIRAVSTL
jgi:hypothetical protein